MISIITYRPVFEIGLKRHPEHGKCVVYGPAVFLLL